MESTDITGLLIVRLGVQHNDDGWFKENWHREKMVALGLPDFTPVQQNVTQLVSRGITRGFYAEPWDRLISVLQGRAMMAWVDLREGTGFGRVFTLDVDRGTSVFVPRGVAQAHQVLEDNTIMGFLLEHHWTPQARHRYGFVNVFDPALGITWPIGRERATVAHRDTLLPALVDTKPIPPRRILVAGTETRLGRALLAELPNAIGLTTAQLELNARGFDDPDFDTPDFDTPTAPPSRSATQSASWTRSAPRAPGAAQPADGQVDLSAFDTIINAWGETGNGIAGAPRVTDTWAAAAARSHRLSDIARRHGLRYVHVSADPVFDSSAPEQPETEPVSLLDPHGQSLAAGEVVAAGLARHLVVRTGWVIGRGEGFLESLVTAGRRGERRDLVADRHGRITFAHHLAAGITHLLDSGAASGTYNVTGDGRVTTWGDVAHRIFRMIGADVSDLHEVPAGSVPGGPPPASTVLSLEKVKATGFRPSHSWLELGDHLPRPGAVPRPEGVIDAHDSAASVRRLPYRILFVCTANICRSAYADVVANRSTPADVEFRSAGTRALVGHPMDPPMAERIPGLANPPDHRARQLTRDLVAESDLILTMAADHRRYILDEWPAMGRKAFLIGHVARELERLPDDVTLEGLVDHLWRHRTAGPDDTVADPYRRGPAAMKAAADQIDRYLAIITKALARLAQ